MPDEQVSDEGEESGDYDAEEEDTWRQQPQQPLRSYRAAPEAWRQYAAPASTARRAATAAATAMAPGVRSGGLAQQVRRQQHVHQQQNEPQQQMKQPLLRRQQQQQQQQQQWRHPAAATFMQQKAAQQQAAQSAATRSHASTMECKGPAAETMQRVPSPALTRTRSEAATTIQAAWRCWRLARHQRVLWQLSAAQRQLGEARARFAQYVAENSVSGGADSAAHLSHQQYLICQELVTRVLLQLDSVTCGGATELRQLRKRLVATSISVLDAIQAAYSRAVSASMRQDGGPCTAAPAPPAAGNTGGSTDSLSPATQPQGQDVTQLCTDSSPYIHVRFMIGPKPTCEAAVQTD